MPGGMGGGGLDSLLGGVVRGLSKGMGGMGASGMGGMNGFLPGGTIQGAEPVKQPNSTAAPVNEYDIDRWKRADDLDSVTTPAIQEVKEDWAKREKKKRLGIKKREKTNTAHYLNQTREQSPKEQKEENDRIDKAASGTVYMPEMKKAARRIGRAGDKPEMQQEDDLSKLPRTPDPHRKNYLGLGMPSGIEPFVTENPINSLYLAVDTLSATPLALGQIFRQEAVLQTEADAPEPVKEKAAGSAAENKILQRVGTEAMQAFHEEREARKYDVRMID